MKRPSLLDSSYRYYGEESHSDPDAFRKRMQKRRRQAQQTATHKAPNVTVLPVKTKGNAA